MGRVLIDNSTISSVQRALGKAPLKEPALLDIEHVSLARFCEAVLLNEQIIVPDNYKKELTPARKSLLKNKAFHFESLNTNEDQDLIQVSSAMMSIWSDAFRAGSERSLFSEYFLQVNAFSDFIWEYSSSEFFLVFRAHGIDKESPLIEAILSSPSDEVLGKQLRILGSDGAGVNWDKLSKHVQRMLSVMGWIGNQYIWHQVFAAQHECSYMPHPLRDFFAYDFLNRINSGAKSGPAFAEAFTNGIGRFQGKLRDSLKSLGGVDSASNIVLPGFLPLLIRESTSGDDFLDVLFQIRDEKETVELREMLSNIQESIAKEDYKPLSKLVREIENIGKNILREKGIEERFITLTPPTTLLGIKVEGDDAGIRFPIL